MPLFVFISGYFSKNLEKRRKTAFEGLLIPYLLAQIVIGLIVLITDRNLNLLRNPLFAFYGTWYLIAMYLAYIDARVCEDKEAYRIPYTCILCHTFLLGTG